MNDKVLYIKKLRNDSDDTQTDLSLKLKKSSCFISEIESGKRNLKDDTFKDILGIYNEYYIEDDDIVVELKELIEKYIVSIIEKERSLTKELALYYKNKRSTYIRSKGSIYTFLMDFFVCDINDDASLISCKDRCFDYISYFESNYCYMYAVMLSLYFDIYEYEDEIYSIYEWCMKEKSMYNLEPTILGMFYYQLGRLYDIKRKYIESYDMCLKSIVYFDKTAVFERSLQAKIQIAGLYLSLKMYDRSESEYIKLLDISLKNDYKYRASVCADNLAYLYILTRQFDKASYYIEKAYSLESKFSQINYFKGYVCYKTENKELARKHIKELINNEDDKYTKIVLKMIHSFLNNNEEKAEIYFNKAKNINIKNHDKLEIENLYNMICDYLKMNNIEKYYKYLEDSIKYR